MKRSIEVLLVVAAVGLTTAVGTVRASEEKKPESPAKIAERAKYDADHDGKLNAAEKASLKADKAVAKAERESEKRAKALEKYDANKNGVFDPEEEAKWTADLEAAKEKRREKAAEKAAAKEAAGKEMSAKENETPVAAAAATKSGTTRRN